MLALSQLRRVQVSRKQAQLKKANLEQELVPLPQGVGRVQTAMGGRVNCRWFPSPDLNLLRSGWARDLGACQLTRELDRAEFGGG